MTEASPRVVVAGGTGLIGRSLVQSLTRRGFEVVVLSRRARTGAGTAPMRFEIWDARTPGAWSSSLAGAVAVVNLAGAGVADRRWTERYRDEIVSSRLDSTRALVEALESARPRPRVLLQSSAVGWYGDRGEEPCPESAPPGIGFLAELAREWEEASLPVESLGVRRVLLRTGVVLAREGGALAKMLPAFRLGLGGPLGNGRQWFPWIHAADEISAIQFLLEREDLSGPFNLVAPAIVRQREFAAELGRALRRPAVLPVPQLALRLLFGEMGSVLLASQRVVPERLLSAGYAFRFPELGPALADLLRAPAR